ncbi:protein SHOOT GRAVITROPISM 5-like [Cucurbita moschata]|uniref:Protein SHOOT GRAVITROPISM 5-like n=1 Tax=Cucurbita moschata TaxID=3662 RepID=A0A6J1EE04_CUCMO|nr:protein SHOOT GRAVITROPISM 5-like [Cucurbita moschata]XP_022924155.1 protein SHOOT GRAVITROPISM 5-like [Cucurbita moschata]
MLADLSSPSLPCFEPLPNCFESNGTNTKRKRRPAGTPDPDAEVVSLSPKTLLESDHYVCEICNQGFQRDQNLQMHRRRHKVPWKLLKRTEPTTAVRKRVFVCPEPSCLHHNPTHALGDLVGIKKHFRRKHSNHKQWVCEKCSKGYAVQSDYKAHLKTCGTRGHSCDCGRVFSRVESFIEHQDSCKLGHHHQQSEQKLPCLSRTASSPTPSPSSDTNFSFFNKNHTIIPQRIITHHPQNLELQLSNNSTSIHVSVSPKRHENYSTHLQLSIGSCNYDEKNDDGDDDHDEKTRNGLDFLKVKEEAKEQMRVAMEEKAIAEEARNEAKKQIEIAEKELANAKRMRQEAQGELQRALALKEHAMKQINSTILQITCQVCRQHFEPFPTI